MTGLENILAQIETEAKAKAAKITAEAERSAEKCVDEAVLKAEEISNDYKALAQKRAEELISRAKTADEVKLSRARLLKKQQIIKATFENAKTEIKQQKASDYFAFLESLLKKYALEKPGTIVLDAEDIKEVTDSFKTMVNQYGLEVSAGNVSARNGFILVYGSIEVNCTIDAVLDAEAEEISDMLNEFLFGCEGGI
ncbi:MAG: V-type ATP synthase subunit E [Clostridia bacterium]|nr:V-type ATP synthase subunit E [Clostridia bacterium]